MEDYDRFVQQRLSCLRKAEEEHRKPAPASSSIRVRGQAILPPLLSGDRREEMQRLRDAAVKAEVHRKLKHDARMAYVQTILHSVQLRQTPTLEELLQESEINPKPSHSHNPSSEEPQSHYSTSSKDNSLLPSPPERKHGVSPPQLTSTTNSAFHQQQHLFDFLTFLSNVESGSSVSRCAETEPQSSSDGGFFPHSASATVTRMPDIISHPPMDGEELERSGLDSSLCNQLLVGEHSATCEGFPVERCDRDNLPVTAALYPDRGHGLDRTESPASSSENGGFSDNSDNLRATTEPNVQHEAAEEEEKEEEEEEPRRLSLQALLKKSQEYRRRQRMLKNQTKHGKIQEQPRARVEEQSLSDKENEEFPFKGTVEGKKPKGTSTPPNKLGENERTFESTHSIGDGNSNDSICVEEDKNSRNNKLNFSQEVLTESAQISTFPQQQSSSAQEAFYCPPWPTAAGKYSTIPAPSLCRSPVHCKRSVFINAGSNGEHKVEEVHLGHEKPPTEVPPPLSFMVEGDLMGTFTKSSQHIDHLESNLSSLKVLISDLESTLIDSLENHSQLSEFGGQRSHRGQSDNNRQGNSEPEPHISEAGDFNELGPDKTSPGRGKESGTSKEVLPQSPAGCGRQQPARHCPPPGQRLQPPAVFRKLQPGAERLRKPAVLSDTSNHPPGGRREAPGAPGAPGASASAASGAPGAPGASASAASGAPGAPGASAPGASGASGASGAPGASASGASGASGASAASLTSVASAASLNQSYDVAAPSRLWLLEGPGSSRLTSGASKVKRRLLMPHTPGSHSEREERLQSHAAQVLALRCRVLQSLSFPCPMPGSRFGDTLTSPGLSQVCSPVLERCRPLLLAAVQGFLTRRLLRTERLAQLARTIRDTLQLLQALQSPGAGRRCREDRLLQHRASLQLRAARYEVSDIFSLTAAERMSMISWDREHRRQSGNTEHPRRKSFLSAATQKSLERKRLMIQKKAAGRPRGAVRRTSASPGSLETKRGQTRGNPQRVPLSSRPRGHFPNCPP